MTKSESWKTATEVYHVEREESRRAAFLEEACAGDETLLREALSLLSGVARVELTSDSPAVDEAVSEVGFCPVSSPARPSREGPALLGAAGIGRQLAHYEIVSRVGAGGMGEAFRARDLKRGRDVAIKAMHKGFSSKPDRLRRFVSPSAQR